MLPLALSRACQRSSEPSWAAAGTLSSAFIHIRACLPQDYPHIRMWLQHLTWFWPSWVDIEQRELGWRPRVSTFSS